MCSSNISEQPSDPRQIFRGEGQIYVEDARAPFKACASSVRMNCLGADTVSDTRGEPLVQRLRIRFGEPGAKHSALGPNQLLLRPPGLRAASALGVALGTAMPDVQERKHETGAFATSTSLFAEIGESMVYMPIVQKMLDRAGGRPAALKSRGSPAQRGFVT